MEIKRDYHEEVGKESEVHSGLIEIDLEEVGGGKKVNATLSMLSLLLL